MVQMRAQKRKEAFHEPPPHPIPLPLGGGEGARRAGERVVHGPNACEKRKGAFHEPYPLISSFSPSGGEGARRAGEGDSDRFMAPIHVRILEVFPSHESPPLPSLSPARSGGVGARRAGEGAARFMG